MTASSVPCLSFGAEEAGPGWFGSSDGPSWLTDEPVLEMASDQEEKGDSAPVPETHNSLLSSAWWKKHPEVHFDPAFGITGGEDMVFYQKARAAGLTTSYAERALVFENEPSPRLSLGYQLWLFFWLGNSSYVTRRATGQASPFRMFLQGGNTIRKAVARTTRRVLRRESPQLRYCLAIMLNGVGMMIGLLGIRVSHHKTEQPRP